MPKDKDTQQILTDADHVKSMVGSDGWKFVYAKLSDRIIDLQNIHNLDYDKPETLGIQLAARKMAVEVLKIWLQADVYGFVEQQEANNQKTLDKEVDAFIGRE